MERKVDECGTSCNFLGGKRAQQLGLKGCFSNVVSKQSITDPIQTYNCYICDETCYWLMYLSSHCIPGIPKLQKVRTFPNNPVLY